MAWSTPATAAGGILTDTIWNASVRDDLLYLKDREDNPARARAFHNTTQSIANATATALAFNSEAYDSAGLHDTATNNSRLTVPSGEGGTYLATGVVQFAANATGQRQAEIRASGTAFLAGDSLDAAAGANVTNFALVWMGALVAGDYLELVVSQNSGGALNVTAECEFALTRIA